MKSKLILSFAFLVIFTFSGTVLAQKYDVFGDLLSIAEQEVDKEAKPLLKAFGTVTGGGMFTTADLHSVGGFELGVHTVGAIIPEKDQLRVFDGINLIGVPLIHASVGLPANLELSARVFSYKTGETVEGNVTVIGGGLKYGLLQLPALPKVSLLAAYHALIPPDDFQFGTVSTYTLKALVSHNFLIFTLYGGAGIDVTNLEIDVPAADIPAGVQSLYPNGFNKLYENSSFQGAIGLLIIPIPFFRFNAAFNFGAYSGFDIGLVFSFR